MSDTSPANLGRKVGLTVALLSLPVVAVAIVVGWLLAPFGRPQPAVTPVASGPVATPLNAIDVPACLVAVPSTGAYPEVLGCDEPHRAEYLARVPAASVLPEGDGVDDPAAPYPGSNTLDRYGTLACQSSSALDLDRANSVAELGVVAMSPTAGEWASGLRHYHCIAAADEPWTGSVAAG